MPVETHLDAINVKARSVLFKRSRGAFIESPDISPVTEIPVYIDAERDGRCHKDADDREECFLHGDILQHYELSVHFD
jgi:hypothetical protein